MAKGKTPKPASSSPEIYALCDFLHDLSDARRLENTNRYCFILGSGASLPSGIMSGRELATNWIKEMYLRTHPGAKPIEVTDQLLAKWATPTQLKIPKFTFENRASFYGQLFAWRFRSNAKLGQDYLKHVISGKTPSFGYTVLAQVLAKTEHRIVITTNFDHLTEDALQRFAGVEPHVVGDEELAKYLSTDHKRPIIAKIHGDIFLKTYNAVEDIAKLRDQWEVPLRSILRSYIPIFVGYGGNDPGFMNFLTQEGSKDWLPNGFIWTYRQKSGLPNNPLIQKLAGKHHGRFVPIPGFDEFFLLLGDVFDIGKLDKQMEADNAKRVDDYRKSFDSVIATLRDGREFIDAAHYPELVRAVISRLAGEKSARGWWDWQVEAEKESSPEQALKVYGEARTYLPNSPQLLAAFTGFLACNFPTLSEAETIGKLSVELAEKSNGPEHPITLSSQNNLALLYKAKGEYDKALPLYEQTLTARERVSGAEHPDTLVSRNNLALLYKAKGEYGKALPLYEQTLAARERILGAEHPNTLNSRNNLALLYKAKGEYDKALPLYEQTLAIRERVSGVEHPDTLVNRNNLASLYVSKGEYNKALPLLEQTLAARERVLGAEHPDTLTSRNNLALLYQSKGDYDKALPLLEQTLATSERVLGVEHPDTLTSRNNLAQLYQIRGEYDKALPLYEQTLTARERVLGADHPNTLTSQNNLAMLFKVKGEFDKALSLLKQTLATSERVLGAEHPDTLTSRNNLASLYGAKGDYDKALPLLKQTLAASERVLGAEHPDTLINRNNLAMVYKVKGEYDKALPLYEQTLATSERVLGAEHPDTRTTRNNLKICREAAQQK
jgi:tetratricopeptide (TPR) repeat protein